jgi:hypothetical protein
LKGESKICIFRVNVAILNKAEYGILTPEKYKNWPDEAIEDLGSVVDQVCGVPDQYIEQFGIGDSSHITHLNNYREKPKVTKDNATDPFIKDYVIPDLLKVRILVNLFSESFVI